jgi:hypothetical protein
MTTIAADHRNSPSCWPSIQRGAVMQAVGSIPGHFGDDHVRRCEQAARRSQGKRAGQAPLLPDDVRLRIADEHAAGKSLNAIALALNAEDVPTAKGAKWYASTISYVIRSVEVDQQLAILRSGVPA